MASVNLLALSISPPTSYPEERFLAGYGSISRSCDLDYPVKQQALPRLNLCEIYRIVWNSRSPVSCTSHRRFASELVTNHNIMWRALKSTNSYTSEFYLSIRCIIWQGNYKVLMVRLPHSNIQSCAVEVVLTFVFVNEHLTIRQYFQVLFVFQYFSILTCIKHSGCPNFCTWAQRAK